MGQPWTEQRWMKTKTTPVLIKLNYNRHSLLLLDKKTVELINTYRFPLFKQSVVVNVQAYC